MTRCPPGCDAYIPLDGVDPPQVVYIPAWWCARIPALNGRIRVGDDDGRRAIAVFVDSRLGGHDSGSEVTYHGFLVEGLEAR
jgi:hypothetical protein